jgi:hypothetical protein
MDAAGISPQNKVNLHVNTFSGSVHMIKPELIVTGYAACRHGVCPPRCERKLCRKSSCVGYYSANLRNV